MHLKKTGVMTVIAIACWCAGLFFLWHRRPWAAKEQPTSYTLRAYNPHIHYTFRLTNRVENSDKLALKGSHQMAAGNYFSAILSFGNAMEELPDAPTTVARREAYQKQRKRAFRLLLGLD